MFNQEKFMKWEEETCIPEKTKKMIMAVANSLGIYLEEVTITLQNRGGFPYAFGKGLRYTFCTSSMENGPEEDWHEELERLLRNFGFRVADSYGDNGLDSSTNWHDTFWNYEYIYCASEVYYMEFDD